MLSIRSFVKHLRLNYQIFILSGAFLAGGLFSNMTTIPIFVLNFFVLNIFLGGGATAYNSYWDKDDGPIGGLYEPPALHRWMLFTSLSLKFFALIICTLTVGISGFILSLSSIYLSILYSSPQFRWKEKPLHSIVIIFLGSGLIAFLLGFISAGTNNLDIYSFMAAISAGFIVISLYPLSQSYQLEQDRRKGFKTIAMLLRKKGLILFYAITFFVGLILLSWALLSLSVFMGILTFMMGTIFSIILIVVLHRKLTMTVNDYKLVMTIKYFFGITSLILITITILFTKGHLLF